MTTELPRSTPEEELQALLQTVIPVLPDAVGQVMLRDAAVLKALQLSSAPMIRLMDERFSRDHVLDGLRSLVNGKPVSLISMNAALTIESAEIEDDGAGNLRFGTQTARFPNIGLLSEQIEQRERTFDEMLAGERLPPDRARSWRDRILLAPLENDEFISFELELSETPEGVLQDISDTIVSGEAEFKDLVPERSDYYLALLGLEEIPETLPAFNKAWIAALRGQDATRLRRQLRLSAPMAVLPSDLVGEASELIPESDRIDFAHELAALPDAFSVLAGFRIAARFRQEVSLNDLATRLANDLARADGMNDPATDFASAFAVTYAVITRDRILRKWPVYARQIAALVHSSHIVRILAESSVQRPELGDRIMRIFGLQARLGELLDGHEATVFQPQYLGPAQLYGITIGRISEVIAAIPESERPSTWVESLTAGIQKGRELGWGVLYFAAGPLDEFAAGWSGLSPVDVEHVDQFHSAIRPPSDPEFGINQLFKISLAFDLVDDDRAKFAEQLPNFIAVLSEADFGNGVELALQIAARWRDLQLSDALFELVVERSREGNLQDLTLPARAMLAAANSALNRDERSKRISNFALRLALASKPGSSVENLARALDVIADMEPELGREFARARSFALLASNRFS